MSLCAFWYSKFQIENFSKDIRPRPTFFSIVPNWVDLAMFVCLSMLISTQSIDRDYDTVLTKFCMKFWLELDKKPGDVRKHLGNK